MPPLRYSINVTLDGRVDHTAVIPEPEMHAHAERGIAAADGLLMGRITYQLMEDGWREVAETGVRPEWMEEWMLPFAHTIHAIPKYVVSSTLEAVDWNNAELVRGDLGEFVRELKAQPGRGIAVGGVTMPLALVELGLIDEYEFIVHPRIVGGGRSLFAGLSKPLDLELIGRQEFGSGAVVLRYRVRG